MNIDKIDILFIRACKSRDSHTRIKSIYRRFFASSATNRDMIACVTARLAAIIDTYKIANYGTMVREKHWHMYEHPIKGGDVNVNDFLFNHFVSVVRLSPVVLFGDDTQKIWPKHGLV